MKTYWQWFFSRTDDGISRFANRWLFVHLFAGVAMYLAVPLSLSDAAKAVLLPLVSVLVGLTFAWAGNAQALLRSIEIENLSKFVPGGFATYAYAFQTAILAVLVTVSLWGIAGLALFDGINGRFQRGAIGVALYAIASLAVRECWHVVLGAQSLLIAAQKMRESKSAATHKDDRDGASSP